RNEAASELIAVSDADRPGVIFSVAVALLKKLLEHDRDLLTVRSCQRIELERVPADRQILLVGGSGDRPIDVGELAAARLVPCPHFRRHVLAHRRIPFCQGWQLGTARRPFQCHGSAWSALTERKPGSGPFHSDLMSSTTGSGRFFGA